MSLEKIGGDEMDYTKEIIKQINKMSNSKSSYQIFCDWIKCTALAIAQSVFFTSSREGEFNEIKNNYSDDDITRMSKMTGMLIETFEDHFGDILGNLFMLSGWGNKNTGQYFTPYSLSLATASCIDYSDKIIVLNEPSAGAGGMIIATAESMKNNGIDFQKKLRVIAQDLDYNALYMCYIQLSLYGIDAKVIQGDTLENKSYNNCDDHVFLTPMFFMNGCTW